MVEDKSITITISKSDAAILHDFFCEYMKIFNIMPNEKDIVKVLQQVI